MQRLDQSLLAATHRFHTDPHYTNNGMVWYGMVWYAPLNSPIIHCTTGEQYGLSDEGCKVQALPQLRQNVSHPGQIDHRILLHPDLSGQIDYF